MNNCRLYCLEDEQTNHRETGEGTLDVFPYRDVMWRRTKGLPGTFPDGLSRPSLPHPLTHLLTHSLPYYTREIGERVLLGLGVGYVPSTSESTTRVQGCLSRMVSGYNRETKEKLPLFTFFT